RAVLLGHSNGMPTIRQFYRRFPTKTLALIDIDGTLKPYFTDPAQMAPFLDQLKAPTYRETATGFINSMQSPGLTPELKKSIMEMMLKTQQHVMSGTLEASLDNHIWEKDPIRVPFL